MAIKFTNNATGELSVGIAAGDVSLTLQTGQGDRFPSVSNPNYFFITLTDSNGNREIVKCTGRGTGSNNFTIVRGQEGTSARAWLAGDNVGLRLTAGALQAWEDAIQTLISDLDNEEAALVSHKGAADHDSRYYTKTNIQTSGQASVHAGNLTNKSTISHSELTDNEAAKHRVISDGTNSSTVLWSGSHLTSAFAGKANASHDHNGSYSVLGHTHDERYYTEGESEARIAAVSQYYGNYYATNVVHDDRYYTKAQCDAAIAAAIAVHAAVTVGVHGHTGDGGGDAGS
jgi:hypothetical protein